MAAPLGLSHSSHLNILTVPASTRTFPRSTFSPLRSTLCSRTLPNGTLRAAVASARSSSAERECHQTTRGHVADGLLSSMGGWTVMYYALKFPPAIIEAEDDSPSVDAAKDVKGPVPQVLGAFVLCPMVEGGCSCLVIAYPRSVQGVASVGRHRVPCPWHQVLCRRPAPRQGG